MIDCNDLIAVVSCSVAKDPSTSERKLAELANDENATVRFEVACNPNTTPRTLIKLAEDVSRGVRLGVEQNPNTPELVKLYLKNPNFAGLTLKEFLAVSGMVLA
jgi:hypothetical protein